MNRLFHVHKRRFRCFVILFMFCGLVAGCGSTSVSTQSSGTSLDGNWLIVGSVPTFSAPAPQADMLNLAVTLDESGTALSGRGSFGALCGVAGGGGGSWGFQSSGIGSTGNFILEQSFGSADYSFQVDGVAPGANQSSWTGTLAVTSTITCPAAQVIPITATKLGNATGTYVGTAFLGSSGSTILVPVTIQAQLQQGGTLPATGTFSNTVLTGSVQVDGLPCVALQTFVPSQVVSSVTGDLILIDWLTPNGETFRATAYFGNDAATTLNIQFLNMTGAPCASDYSAINIQLVKQ